MSNTKREPLLSDDMLKDAEEVVEVSSVPVDKLYRFREIYEAARAKDAELIQRLVDTIGMIDKYAERETMSSEEEDVIVAHWNAALDAAEAAGFKPSTT